MTDESGPPVDAVHLTTEKLTKADRDAIRDPEISKTSQENPEAASVVPDLAETSASQITAKMEQLESQKPRFKTNTVNMKFRTSPPSAETLVSSSLSTPSTSRQTVSKLTLPNKKASADSNCDENRSRSASVEPKATEAAASLPKTAAADTTSAVSEVREAVESPGGKNNSRNVSKDSANHASGNSSGEATDNASANHYTENATGGVHHTKHDYTEEELSHKGISVAGRFHSASNVNWEDEEEEWQPQASMPIPSFGTSSVVSNLKSRKSPMRFDSGSVVASTVVEDLTAKPRAATLVASTSSDSQKLLISAKNGTPPTDSDGKNEGETAWGARKQTVAPSSLGDRIREAKSAQEPAKIAQKARIGMNAHQNTAPTAGNSDALNRFRIRAAPVMGGGGFGRGPPPLNPRRLAVDDDEPRAFHMAGDAQHTADVNFDFGRRGPLHPPDNFDFNRRLAPSDGSAAAPAPFSRGNLPPHRPIPARFLKPAVGGTAGVTPSIRTSSASASTSGAGASMSSNCTGSNGTTDNDESSQNGNRDDSNCSHSNMDGRATEHPDVGTEQSDSGTKEPANTPTTIVNLPAPIDVVPHGNWQAQKAAIQPPLDIKEIQKKEMVDQLAALKARQEKRQREDEEKKRRIEEKLEKMRQEKLKQEDEEKKRLAAELAAKQAQKEAERDRRAKEAAERTQRASERAAQRAAKQAEIAVKPAIHTVAHSAVKEANICSTISMSSMSTSVPTSTTPMTTHTSETKSSPVINEWEAEKERRRMLREEVARTEPSQFSRLAKSTKSEKMSKSAKHEPKAGRTIKLPTSLLCNGPFDVQALLRLKSKAPPKAKTMPRTPELSLRVCLPIMEGKTTQPTLVHMKPNKKFMYKRSEAGRA